MRNYLQFDNIPIDNIPLDNNYINSLNDSYIIAKKKFNTHNNDLKHFKNLMKNERINYETFNNNINDDFINKNMSNMTKDDLIKQFVFIINNSDEEYIKKINNIQTNINTHQTHTDYFMKLLKTLQNVLNKHIKNFMNINYYIRTFTNIIINKHNLESKKKTLHKFLEKLISHKSLMDNNINNSFNKILIIPNEDASSTKNIDMVQNKIYNISNIINKNDILKKKIQENMNNTQNQNHLAFLKILHNNSIKNNTLFGGKLKQYYNDLNNITNKIDNNIKTNFTEDFFKKKHNITKLIQSITPKTYKSDLKTIQKLCKELVLNKTKYISPNKIKILLKKFNKLNYSIN